MESLQYRQALDGQGVQYHYEEAIPLDQIDVAKGLRNQARLELPLDPELVTLYHKAMRDGVKFPPLVLWRTSGRARYTPVDGNHRLAAALKDGSGVTALDAYILDTTDKMIVDRVTWSFNNKVNGKRISQEEALEHAKTFVKKYGISAEAAAEEWGVSKGSLHTALRIEGTKEILLRNGVKHVDRLGTHQLDRLGTLASAGEDLVVRAAEVSIENGFGQHETDRMLDKVKRAPTSDKKMKAVEDYAKSPEAIVKKAETKGGRIRPTPLPRTRLLRMLTDLSEFLDEFSDDTGLRPSPADLKAARENGGNIVARLIPLLSLGKIVDEKAV